MRKGTVIYMICPKCGQEYEGDKCPRCNGPEVIVNNADYLKRKRAYEEKQAGKGSASSDKETSENNTEIRSHCRKVHRRRHNGRIWRTGIARERP